MLEIESLLQEKRQFHREFIPVISDPTLAAPFWELEKTISPEESDHEAFKKDMKRALEI